MYLVGRRKKILEAAFFDPPTLRTRSVRSNSFSAR